MRFCARCIFAALCVLPCFVSCTRSGSITLRLSEIHAEGYPTALADAEFSRLVAEKTGGRITIEVHAGGSLFNSEDAAIKALQAGKLDFARVSASPVGTYVPEINAHSLPYLYNNADHMWRVLNGKVGQQLLDNIEKSGSGLVGLCYYAAGSRSFYLTKPVRDIKDFAGLKIRVQNNVMMVRMVELLGAKGVTGISANDVKAAIQNGSIDGAENNWPTYESMGDYTVARYYILDSHTRVPEILLGSSASMKRLSPQDAAIIRECAKKTQEFEFAQWAKKEAASEAIIRATGQNTIIELSDRAFNEFQKAMDPLYSEYGAEYTSVINQIKALGD